MNIKTKDLRIFAYIWTAILLLFTFYPLINNGNIRFWSLFLALLFVTTGTFAPRKLELFYKIWIKFGEFIGNIISKIILFLIFYSVFTLYGFVTRLFNKDLLNKKIEKNKKSYWIDRQFQPTSMKNQY